MDTTTTTPTTAPTSATTLGPTAGSIAMESTSTAMPSSIPAPPPITPSPITTLSTTEEINNSDDVSDDKLEDLNSTSTFEPIQPIRADINEVKLETDYVIITVIAIIALCAVCCLIIAITICVYWRRKLRSIESEVAEEVTGIEGSEKKEDLPSLDPNSSNFVPGSPVPGSQSNVVVNGSDGSNSNIPNRTSLESNATVDSDFDVLDNMYNDGLRKTPKDDDEKVDDVIALAPATAHAAFNSEDMYQPKIQTANSGRPEGADKLVTGGTAGYADV